MVTDKEIGYMNQDFPEVLEEYFPGVGEEYSLGFVEEYSPLLYLANNKYIVWSNVTNHNIFKI